MSAVVHDQIPLRTTNQLLDLLRAKYSDGRKPASDYRLAKVLDKTIQTVRRWSRGAGTFGREECALIAEKLGMPVDYVVACVEAEREKSEKVKPVWIRLGQWSVDELMSPAQRRELGLESREAQLQAILPKPPGLSPKATPAESRRKPGRPRLIKSVVVSALVLAGMASVPSELRAESRSTSRGPFIHYAKERRRRRRLAPEHLARLAATTRSA